MAAPVIVVGAGLAGLACARELEAKGLECLLLEASDGVGGRVRTDEVDGFLLDRGFQVYLTAYPEGERILNYEALNFQRFTPGAMVRFNGKFHKVVDPWREPFAALASLLSPVGSMADKLRVARLRGSAMAGTPDGLLGRREMSSMELLRDYGFGDNMIERFFQPFFGSVLLDAQLRPSSRMLEYVFRMMAEGDTVLPADGMGAIPQQLASGLKKSGIRMNARVKRVAKNSVELEDGQVFEGSAVVVATEGYEALKLLPPALLPELGNAEGRKVMNLYFSFEGEAPITEPIIILNGNLEWPVQSLCFPSVVAPSYAPEGYQLVSVSVLGNPLQEDRLIESTCRTQMERWFGKEARRWQHMRTYRIPYAHPANSSSKVKELPVKLENGVYICGDHRYFPSINAALVNGRHAAEAVAADLGHA